MNFKFDIRKNWNRILFIVIVFVIFYFDPYYIPLFARYGEFPPIIGYEIYYPYIFGILFFIILTGELIFRYEKISTSEKKVVIITNLYFFILAVILITYKIFFGIGLKSSSLLLIYLFGYYFFYNQIIGQYNLSTKKKIIVSVFFVVFFPMFVSENSSPKVDTYYLIPGETYTDKEITLSTLFSGIHSIFFTKVWNNYEVHNSLFHDYHYKFRGLELFKTMTKSLSYIISFLLFIFSGVLITLNIKTFIKFNSYLKRG